MTLEIFIIRRRMKNFKGCKIKVLIFRVPPQVLYFVHLGQKESLLRVADLERSTKGPLRIDSTILSFTRSIHDLAA